MEIRRRLADLIGDDARGVTVLTCHGMAMRLVGASFAGRANRLEQDDFHEVMRQAVALLRGQGLPPEEADEHRERLLAGFRWILVDEYQDFGPEQYDLISALAGRTLEENDEKLTMFAVGDDDQNIYAFNGSSTEFIRRFEADYRRQALLPHRQLPFHRAHHRRRQQGDRAGEATDEREPSHRNQPGPGAGPGRRRLDPARPGGPGTGAGPACRRHLRSPRPRRQWPS